jgi:hypothetical protein
MDKYPALAAALQDASGMCTSHHSKRQQMQQTLRRQKGNALDLR